MGQEALVAGVGDTGAFRGGGTRRDGKSRAVLDTFRESRMDLLMDRR